MSGESMRIAPVSEGDRSGALAYFRSHLRRLKSEGCNLLLAGEPSREVFTRASETLLGDSDIRRWRVFALTDADPESVYDRLPAASVAPRPPAETTRVVNHATPPRPITAAADGPEATLPEVTVGDANLAGLRTQLCETIADLGARSCHPSELRVAVDSLAPLLAHYEFDVVRRFLRLVGNRVREHDGMAHYVLPDAYDSDRCQRLAGEFDAVVELRTVAGDHDAEARWHLREPDVTTPWVPL